MSTIATQCYNKIASKLSPDELTKFNKNWLRKTKYPTTQQWHTEWYCEPMKKTFSLLHAPVMKDVKIKKTGEILLDAMTFFDDDTIDIYSRLSKKNIMAYDSNIFKDFCEHIPGVTLADKAGNIATMFLGGLLGYVRLEGAFSKTQNQWINEDEITILRLTKNQNTTSARKVLICRQGYCEINDSSEMDLFTPTLVYY